MLTLQDEVMINGMRLRNRIAMPPLTTNYGSPEGMVTEEIIQFYKERSKDVGLVIVEASAVRADGRILAGQPGTVGGWAGGRYGTSCRFHQKAGCCCGGADQPRRCPLFSRRRGIAGGFTLGFCVQARCGAAHHESASQIDQMVADFADAAGRAAEAGFDGVEIHGAHFYLISQFLSPFTNQRNDRYGGDARARATFALEVVRAAREELGKSYPILFRLNAVGKSGRRTDAGGCPCGESTSGRRGCGCAGCLPDRQ